MRRKALTLLFFFLAMAWFIFAFRRYLPQADWQGLRSVWLGFSPRDSTVLDLILVLWFWLTSWISGAMVLGRFRLPPLARSEHFLFASSLGISFWSLAALLLTASRLFYKAEAYGLMVLITLLGLPRIVRAFRGWRSRLVIVPQGWALSFKALPIAALIALTIVVLAIFLISALGPEIEFDARLTHLLAAKIYAQTHRLAEIPDIPQTFFPRNVTLLFALGMVLKGETAARLIQFLLGLLCLLAGYAMASRICRPVCGWIAVAILASSPLLLWEMRTAHLELGLTLYISLALFAAVLWLTGEGRQFAWLGAYFLAFAQGTKYHALWALFALPLAMLLYQAVKARKLTGMLPDITLFTLLSAAGVVPWAIVNLIQTGNPVFPFFNEYFQSPYWSSALSDYGALEMSASGLNVKEEWFKLPGFLWYLVTDQNGLFRGNVGPFYLLLLPLLLFRRGWPAAAKLILIFSAIYSLVWLLTAQHARYFLPLLPGLAAVAATALFLWLQSLERSHRILSAIIVALLFGMAVLNSPFFERLGANARYGSTSVTDKLALAYLAGLESKEDYLRRFIPNHEAVEAFNQAPQHPKKVLFWWTAPNFLAVEKGGFACYYSPYFPEMMSDDPDRLRQVVAENGITHFIVDQEGQDGALATRPDGPFAQAHLKRVFQKNGVILYEIQNDREPHETVIFDFVSHVWEADFRSPAPPADKGEARRFVGIGGEKRWALVLTEGEASYRVRLPARPVLRASLGVAGAELCSEISSLQVAVRSADSETIVLDRKVKEGYWADAEVDLAPFAGQDVSIAFRPGPSRFASCGLYCWGDPILVSLPGAQGAFHRVPRVSESAVSATFFSGAPRPND